mgnify:CR=1 FL=1
MRGAVATEMHARIPAIAKIGRELGMIDKALRAQIGIASADIVIEKGPTPFPAGPIVGEFQQAGFPAAIEKGQIVIRKRHVAVAEGDTISAPVASALAKLEIFPITMGMELLGAYDGENFYPPEVLDIDYDEFRGQLQSATAGAFNLAMHARWFSNTTTVPLLSKAPRPSSTRS